ncbi:hypothetical protein Lepto7376_2379 [[Leptolyngbya] sp. PCC 7376]|uniref:hypothetical protein n=1 Tax=[Leptolyngbya] sp. PCC 7376 TaxID=111781 RepID=UPI00029F0895|nr:hypothetical protein [[Leptolyngbya] sp. PCC 7376]AFY38661.1 hypothetical protein Lepto7376_2379 [[Leptolyngbya] sp. PCC 7376]
MPETNQPAPENYNPKTHFLQVAAKSLNPEMREFFDPNGEIEELDITTPTGALRRACLIDVDESLLLNVGKMIFYGLMTGKLSEELMSKFYGIPKDDFKLRRNNLQAQVVLKFQEPSNLQRKARRNHPKRMKVSVPLLKDATDVTIAELTAIKNRLKQRFPEPKSRTDLYLCGNNKYSYYDPEQGLQMPQIQAANQNQAIEFVKDICYCFSRDYDDTRLNESRKINPRAQDETVKVIGKTTRRKKKKVIGYVYLVSATFIGADTGVEELLLYRPRMSI